MGGYGFKLLRVLLGLPVLVGVVLYMRGVRYVVSGTGDAYSRKSEDALPVPERTFFVGISFAFEFTLQVPGHQAELDLDPAKGFRFAVTANPAPEFSVMGEGNAWTVYETMAATAFDGFAGALARGYGLTQGD